MVNSHFNCFLSEGIVFGTKCARELSVRVASKHAQKMSHFYMCKNDTFSIFFRLFYI